MVEHSRREVYNTPMKDKPRVTFNAPVVLGIVGISFLATVLGYLTGGITTRMLFTTYRSVLWSPMTWIRAFTHLFGHADWAHFVGNMSYLLLIGPMLEEKYGSKTLAGVVFAFILLSSFTSFKQGEYRSHSYW